ncbi:MAG: hypothetical protein ACK5QT_04105 [Oligoflexia bacterium]
MSAAKTSISRTLLAALCATLAGGLAHAWPEKWSLQPMDGDTLRFSTSDGTPAPGPLKLQALGIREPQLVGMLESERKAAPYLLISGTSPGSAEKALFLVRADGGLKPQRLTFPGKLLDPSDRKVVYESRFFFGRCLPKQKYDAVVIFQKEHLDRKRGLQRSVYVAEATPTLLEERLLERGLPALQWVEVRMRSKQCTEISGRNRPFNQGFFSLRSRRGSDVTDLDADDDENENQSKSQAQPD